MLVRLIITSFISLILVVIVVPGAMGFLEHPITPETVRTTIQGQDSIPIKVYMPATKQVVEMPLGEYLKGVVAAEMPAEFQDEALKAQFVVARTYAVRRMQVVNGPGRGGCSLSPQADVCADPSTGQAYMSREEAQKKMGTFAAAKLWQRLDEFQIATQGQVLTYNHALIDPLYHSVSGKQTEDSGEYFKESLPYLKPVSDNWGADSPKLMETKHFTLEQLADKLSLAGKAVTVAALGGSKAPVQITAKTVTGRAKTVSVAGVTLTGREFRESLGLASTDFTVSVKGKEVDITTTGYGHGVGMSQYGANGMAKAGKSYKEILLYYYTGVTLEGLWDEKK